MQMNYIGVKLQIADPNGSKQLNLGDKNANLVPLEPWLLVLRPFVTAFHVLLHPVTHQKKKKIRKHCQLKLIWLITIKKLLLLSFSRLHSDSLDVKSKRSPPVWPAEEGIFLPLQLQHKQVTNVHFCVNQEGEGLVWRHFRPVGGK